MQSAIASPHWLRIRIIAISTLLLLGISSKALADDLAIGLATPGLQVYLGNTPRYSQPMYYAPVEPIYYARPPTVVYYPAERWRPGPPPWAHRWHHPHHKWDRDWDR